jgi:hypothetical protein
MVVSCYLATCGEVVEALTFRIEICRVCRSVELLQLPIVTSRICSINPLIIPKLVSGQQIVRTIKLFGNVTIFLRVISKKFYITTATSVFLYTSEEKILSQMKFC